MGNEPYTREDLRELANEIKFLSPRYQKLVLALISASVDRLRDERDSPDIEITVVKDDSSPLPSPEKIFESFFTPGARPGLTAGGEESGKVGDRQEDIGKVGGRFEINLDKYDS
jgi:hypothetical protein